MKFIATTSDKIKKIPVTSGQMIFSRDDRVIYLDAESARTSFQQIISVVNEQTRTELISPVEGFYFVEDTAVLWRYKDNEWIQVSAKPEERVIFTGEEGLPLTGKENVLYVNTKDNKIYRWDGKDPHYIEMNSIQWDEI